MDQFPYQSYYPLDEKSVAMGTRVILKIIDQGDEAKKYGDIHIPDKHYINIEMLKAEVVSIGNEAISEGLQKGDIVVYDRYAAYGKPPRKEGIFVIIDVENIIAIIEE
jgi:co-chaperonin GroES (HSP10)